MPSKVVEDHKGLLKDWFNKLITTNASAIPRTDFLLLEDDLRNVFKDALEDDEILEAELQLISEVSALAASLGKQAGNLPPGQLPNSFFMTLNRIIYILKLLTV